MKLADGYVKKGGERPTREIIAAGIAAEDLASIYTSREKAGSSRSYLDLALIKHYRSTGWRDSHLGRLTISLIKP